VLKAVGVFTCCGLELIEGEEGTSCCTEGRREDVATAVGTNCTEGIEGVPPAIGTRCIEDVAPDISKLFVTGV
jgi:hypothetical protein